MAMQLSGAGRRTIATLSVMLAIAIAGTSPAAERRETKRESISSILKEGSRAAHRPSTESVVSRNGDPVFANASLEPYPNITDPTAPTDEEALLIDLVNAERTSRGLKPVHWDPMLTRLARFHCADMRSVGKSSHNSSKDGADYTTRLARTPYRAEAAAENVAFNASVLKAHRALMHSPGHRRNILDPNLTALGTSVLGENSSGWLYVVEDFATPTANVSDAEAQARVRASLLKGHSPDTPLQEDTTLSKRLGGVVEGMIRTGQVQKVDIDGSGGGWALAFTSLDPGSIPESALKRVSKAQSYSLAVAFRKTPRYPFGAYWAVVFLKGAS